MGRTRKFRGRTTTLWRKCEKSESCTKADTDFTAKEILIDCEGFYYVFKKLEIFEAYPRLDGDVEKHKQDMAEYECSHLQTSTTISFQSAHRAAQNCVVAFVLHRKTRRMLT